MFIWHPTASVRVAPARRAFDDQIWQLGCVSFVKSTSIMRIVRHGPSPAVGFYEYVRAVPFIPGLGCWWLRRTLCRPTTLPSATLRLMSNVTPKRSKIVAPGRPTWYDSWPARRSEASNIIVTVPIHGTFVLLLRI